MREFHFVDKASALCYNKFRKQIKITQRRLSYDFNRKLHYHLFSEKPSYALEPVELKWHHGEEVMQIEDL